MERTVFIVRLARPEGDGAWRGDVEVAGSAERRGLSGPADLVGFIEDRLASASEGQDAPAEQDRGAAEGGPSDER